MLGDRKIALCKELTKRYENVYRTILSEATEHFEKEEPRGEYVLVVAGRTQEELKKEAEEAFRELPIEEHLERYLAEGLDRMEAMKRVAKDRGLSKREIYKSLNCHN